MVQDDMTLEMYFNHLAGIEGSVKIENIGTENFGAGTASVYRIETKTGCEAISNIIAEFYYNSQTNIGRLKHLLVDGEETDVVNMKVQLKNLLISIRNCKQYHWTKKDMKKATEIDLSSNGYEEKDGKISGHGSYPSEGIPDDVNVFAYNIHTKETIKCNSFDRESGEYEINVPNGEYYVFMGNSNINDRTNGFYSQMVLCGLQASCEDHSLIKVVIENGKRVEKIDPGDWYMPQ